MQTRFKMSKKIPIISFGELIRRLREQANLPLRVIAARMEIDPSLLGKIERDERSPSKRQIISLAEIFNQDVHYLLSEYLSDVIAYKILEEEHDISVLKVAEMKVEYLKAKKKDPES